MATAENGFSNRLRSRLAQLGMSQNQLAAKLDVTPATISQWIAGKKSASRDNLDQAATILSVAPEWLAYGAGTAPTIDLQAQRADYSGQIGWAFRTAPPDGGRDYGNANVWAFDPNIATMVRDVLQNCRDAENSPGSPVEVVFRIIRLRGADLDSFKKAVKWDQVLSHLDASAKIDQRLGRLIRHHLKRMETRNEILLLVVQDRGTVGLLGDEFGKGNFAALCRNNLDSQKHGTAGGAFGLGKAVLWRVSRFATVLFGSNLGSPLGEGQQFARVFGRCDLPWHVIAANGDEREFAGPGWFGAMRPDEQGNDRAESFWNNEALMQDLRLEREGHVAGTSIAVVGFHDPSEDQEEDDPVELSDKIERAVADWFWPDLAEGRLSVRVEVWDGQKLESGTDVSGAKHRPELIEAYRKWKEDQTVEHLIQEGDVVAKRVTLRIPSRTVDPKHPASEHEAVVLVRRARDNSASERLNELAMFRGVRMVVQYRSLKGICIGALPFHAVLVCGEAAGADATDKMADRFLRTSEPPAHHEWGSTPDLQTEYKRGGITAIQGLIDAAKAAIREAVRPSVQDHSDGPRSLKELLKVADAPVPKDKPRIVRPRAEITADGSWKVSAGIRVRRSNDTWRVEPVVAFQQETGSGYAVAWRKLEAVANCGIEDGRLVIPANTDEAKFTGETEPDSHPVDATESCVTIDLRRVQRESGGAQ